MDEVPRDEDLRLLQQNLPQADMAKCREGATSIRPFQTGDAVASATRASSIHPVAFISSKRLEGTLNQGPVLL